MVGIQKPILCDALALFRNGFFKPNILSEKAHRIYIQKSTTKSKEEMSNEELDKVILKIAQNPVKRIDLLRELEWGGV